jgi:hypothetical protein
MSDLQGVRAQIIGVTSDTHSAYEWIMLISTANAKIMLSANKCLAFSAGSTNTLTNNLAEIEVAVFGADKYIGAVMVGLTPAIEGPECATPEIALRKLFTTVCEVLALHIPKVSKSLQFVWARADHYSSARSSEMFMVVACLMMISSLRLWSVSDECSRPALNREEQGVLADTIE